MNRSDTSYPISKVKILLLENISDAAVREFGAGGYMEIYMYTGRNCLTAVVVKL